MKNLKTTAFLSAGIILLVASGCDTTGTANVAEPMLAENGQSVIITKDISEIEAEDTSGRVSAAREAAKKLIADAKKEALRIIQKSDKIMAQKSYEAEKRAEEIFTSITEKHDKNKVAKVKEYLQKAKKNAVKKAGTLITSAKKQVSEFKKSAIHEIQELQSKTKNEAGKIASQIIENARKSSSDIILKGHREAVKIKNKMKQLFNAATIYTNKQKKAADEYVKGKMEEADKAIAEIAAKIQKDSKDDKRAKPVVANAILDKILTGLKNNDYKYATQNFTSDLKKAFTEKIFKNIKSQITKSGGEYENRKYLGSLNKGELTIYLWKIKFSKTKDNDMVIKLATEELDGKEQVFGFDITSL